MTEREFIEQQAKALGVEITGKLTRSVDNENNNIDVCFVDEANKLFIIRRGILTIKDPDGKVY